MYIIFWMQFTHLTVVRITSPQGPFGSQCGEVEPVADVLGRTDQMAECER